MSAEDHYIKNVENAIRALRFKTKEKSVAMQSVGFNLNKLKEVNGGMYLELLEKYKNALNIINNE